jgi:hypothetical protein
MERARKPLLELVGIVQGDDWLLEQVLDQLREMRERLAKPVTSRKGKGGK